MPESNPQQLYQEAVKHQEAGRLSEALALYRRVLTFNPNDVVQSLGALAYQFREAGNLDKAAESYRLVLTVRPTDAATLNNLGNILSEKGDLDGAIAVHRQTVALQPQLAEAHFNLANGLYGRRIFDEAIAEYRVALSIKPEFFFARFALGNALAERGVLDEAIDALQRAASLQPGHPELFFNLGHALSRAGRKDEAIASYRRALALRPGYVEAILNLASLLQDQGRHQESHDLLRQAIAIKGDSPELLNNLGSVLHKLERDEESLECYRRALALRPDFPEALHNLANALDRKGDSDEAMRTYERALAIRPEFPEALNSLGSMYYQKGDFDNAEALIQRALAIQPNHADARLNLGLLRLMRGDYARGWEDYEARWAAQKLDRARGFSQPLWQGEDLNGKRILLHVEQGLGDAIQFLRYVPLVRARGGRVLVRCWQALKRLFTHQLGIEQVFHELDPVPEFDVHTPLVSVARILGTTLQTIPSNVPYLMPEPQLVEKWKARLAQQRPGMKVGLVWSGNPQFVKNNLRSIPLSSYAPLAGIPGIQWYSLQKGPAALEARHPPAGTDLIDWSSELTDLAETAALVHNLDLVITTDTAMANLLGALGKDAWVLLMFVPDWRWMKDGTTTPWYPTLKLFRQLTPGDWNEPIRRVAKELRHVAQASSL